MRADYTKFGIFFFSSRRRHTRLQGDWSSDVCSSDDAAFGAASEVTPKFIAPADPATRWTAAHRGPAFFAYSTNYLIDVDNVIMSMSRRPRRFANPSCLQPSMIQRLDEGFHLSPAK